MEPIVRASVADYRQMVDFGNLCFPNEHGIIEQRWCHVWGGHASDHVDEYVENFFLLKEGSHIIGMIAVVPLALRVGDRSMSAGGITAVATHPLYRGKGIMSALLARADQEMRERGNIVAILGGDRSRYAHFGWEFVGTRYELHYPGKYLLQLPDPRKQPVRIRSADASLRSEVLKHYDRHAYAFVRSDELLSILIQRKNAEFWSICDGTVLTCYLATLDDVVCEYGGTTQDLPGLVKYFAQIHDYTEMKILTPSRFGAAEEMLYRYAGSYRSMHVFSMKILRLDDVLQCLLPDMQGKVERRQLPDFAIGLQLRETGETATLCNQKGHLSLSQETPVALLSLGHREMARLLFGPFPEGILSGNEAGFPLGEILPLEINISKIDMV